MNLQKIIEDYNNGDIYILDAYIKIKEYKKKIDSDLDLIKSFESENIIDLEVAIDEHQKKYKGFNFEVRSGRKIFDFSAIKEIQEAKNNLKDLEIKYKLAFAQKQKGGVSINEDSGEILEIPKMIQGKSSIILKPNKS